MPSIPKLYKKKLKSGLSKSLKYLKHWPGNYWRKSRWHKIKMVLAIIIILIIGTMYGIARWYIYSESHIPLQIGVSFSPEYAQSLGLNPQQTMKALASIGVKQFRIMTYWSYTETSPGVYNFSTLDWQFKEAEAAHAKIILVVGL